MNLESTGWANSITGQKVSVTCASVCVCLCVNQGVTIRTAATCSLMLHAKTYWWTLITNQKIHVGRYNLIKWIYRSVSLYSWCYDTNAYKNYLAEPHGPRAAGYNIIYHREYSCFYELFVCEWAFFS